MTVRTFIRLRKWYLRILHYNFFRHIGGSVDSEPGHATGAINWVKNIIHHPKVMFTVNSKSVEDTARAVDKLAELNLTKYIPSRMNKKYGWSDGLIVELTPNN
jgi:hypothetical protein